MNDQQHGNDQPYGLRVMNSSRAVLTPNRGIPRC